MATFKEQVNDLTAFGDTDDTALTDWLTAGGKEIINILPPHLKEKCMTESTITNSPTYLADLDGIGEILHVTRLSADSGGYRIPCRKVPSMYGEITADSGNLMYYATATDPAYWITSSSDATILNVNPTPTANQTAIVYHVAYPAIAHGDSVIANFPDEIEYLVVLYAAIKAAQSLLAREEDDELYVPIIDTLKADYVSGLNMLGVGAQHKSQSRGNTQQRKQLEALAEQLRPQEQ